jgi:hypothetical protein
LVLVLAQPGQGRRRELLGGRQPGPVGVPAHGPLRAELVTLGRGPAPGQVLAHALPRFLVGVDIGVGAEEVQASGLGRFPVVLAPASGVCLSGLGMPLVSAVRSGPRSSPNISATEGRGW